MKKRYFIIPTNILLFIFLMIVNGTLAQRSKIDSLKKELEKPLEDSIRVQVLSLLSVKLQNIDVNAGMQYAREAYAISIKRGFKRSKATFAHIIGIYHMLKNNNDSALLFFEEALKYTEFYKEHHLYPRDIIAIKTLLGQAYTGLDNNTLALDYFKQALKAAEEYGEHPYIFNCLFNIGQLHRSMGLIDEGEKVIQQCLDMARQKKDSANIALAIGEFSSIYRDKKEYAKALHILPDALKIFEKFKDKRNIATAKQCIAFFSIKVGRPDDYISYAYDAKQAFIDLEDEHMLIENNDVFGKYYQAKKMYKEASEYFNKSLELALKLNDKLVVAREHLYLSELEKEQGHYQLALENLIQQKAIEDSVKTKENQKMLMDFATLYKTEQKEKEIIVLNQKNQMQQFKLSQRNNLLYALGGSALLLIVVAWLLYKQKQLINEKKQNELEQRALRSQMNPHFTFNALTSIQKYILENDAASASLYLSWFSKLMRQILESSREDLISLELEIKTIDNYLTIERLMGKEKFDFFIKVDPLIDAEEVFIPPMLIQPFIENSIKHGFTEMTEKGFINIQFELRNNYIYCEISDNGIGRKKAREMGQHNSNSLEKKSLGMEIVKERTQLFNKKNKKRITISVNDIYDEAGEVAGTKVEIIIPLLFKTSENYMREKTILS